MALVCAGLTLAGCTKAEKPADQVAAAPAPTAPPPPATVHIEATEYKFTAPDTLPSGVTTFHLMNNGKEIHHVVIMKTTAENLAKMKPNEPPPPDLVVLGGPNAAAPGGTAEATVDLSPGEYTMVCFVPGPDGKAHFMKGMIHPLTVTAGTSTAVAPTPDITVKLSDYAFELSGPLTAGHHVIRVENAGPQIHEMVFVKLAPGKSMADFAKWAEKPNGPPPGMPINGGGVMTAGIFNTIQVDLTPGDYALICFITDTKDGKPHAAHGMMKAVTIS